VWIYTQSNIKNTVKKQVKNQWENAKLRMLNNKASIDNGIADFVIPSQIKQKLFLLVVLETVIVVDTEFSGTFYKYSI
jgi:hypothetical protein